MHQNAKRVQLNEIGGARGEADECVDEATDRVVVCEVGAATRQMAGGATVGGVVPVGPDATEHSAQSCACTATQSDDDSDSTCAYGWR